MHGNLSLHDLEFIRSQALRTPMRSSAELNAQIGRAVHIKVLSAKSTLGSGSLLAAAT